MKSNYQIVTERVIEELNRGTAPWRRPWTSRLPINAISQKPYHGINTLLLGMAGYPDHRWLTYRQAIDLGGNVRRGEHGTAIVYWHFIDETENELRTEEKKRRIPLVKTYVVFNATQCEGLLQSDGGKLPDLEAVSRTGDGTALEAGRLLLETMPDPPKVERSDKAAYVPSRDVVLMPDARTFQNEAAWVSTLGHELIHSTGNEKRLNRPAVSGAVYFGSEDYSQEELVAELGACFICGELGIAPDFENSASYIDSWRKRLSDDPRLIFRAASAAQKAADFILFRGQ